MRNQMEITRRQNARKVRQDKNEWKEMNAESNGNNANIECKENKARYNYGKRRLKEA
jgi:hypothetical protein